MVHDMKGKQYGERLKVLSSTTLERRMQRGEGIEIQIILTGKEDLIADKFFIKSCHVHNL
jgi:hypothetical protein